MIVLYIILGIVVLLALYVWATYNSLITLKVRVDEAWSDILVQLKRRADLIPNLVNTVKGYATHEKNVFEDIASARASVMEAKNVKDAAKAENELTGALKSIFAVAEAYPELKANQNFLSLQAELTDTEDKIQGSRRFYNGGVRDFNTRTKVFPSNLVANTLKFSEYDFFDLDENEKKADEQPVKVEF